MSDSHELIANEILAKASALAAGTPYVVEATRSGFDVRLDVANPRCFALLRHEGIKTVFTHHVTVDARAKTLTVTDEAQQLQWSSDGEGAPQLRPSTGQTAGHVLELGARKEFDWQDRSNPSKVMEFSFSSHEGRNLVHTAASGLGWNEKTPDTSLGGMTTRGIAILAAVSLVLVLVALVLLFG